MRPEILFDLFASSGTLPHVGPKTAKLLEKCAGPRVLDLCLHLPHSLEKRHAYGSIQSMADKTLASLAVTVGPHHPPPQRGRPYRVTCYDGTGSIDLIFFHAQRDYIHQKLPPGKTVFISGRVELKFGQWQMVHPDHLGRLEDRDHWVGVRPLYALTAGLHGKTLSKIMRYALAKIPALSEWIPHPLLEKYQWPSWKEALLTCHHPKREEDLEAQSPARQRLAFDEILAHQVMFKLLRQSHAIQKGAIINSPSSFEEKVRQVLPFQLTQSQEEVLMDIKGDLNSPKKMVRLLQGDVGSGKTLVAYCAMLQAIEAGFQSAFLAPTEILARQQFETMKKWSQDLPFEVFLLTGSMKAKEKRETLDALKKGQGALVVGTHALMEETVVFDTLGLVVIDEQHRFGVAQRSRLIEKTPHTNVLAMTATPIPRTLALTLYGDMDLSTLREKPAHRQPIETRTLSLGRVTEVYKGLKRIIEKGDQAYWVCPLIEESEALNLGHVEKRLEGMRDHFPGQVAALHGRMKAEEKDAIMQDFKAGRIKILISTTVVEVGVDVPNATVMVIEHAERFGLFQLHQLRGRVGRGTKPSSCLLLYDETLTATGHDRLKILKETHDGFKIAEADLKIRGSGDFLGTRQSGLPAFRFFTFHDHQAFMDDVNALSTSLAKDPKQWTETLKILLYLFNHEQAVPYLRAG